MFKGMQQQDRLQPGKARKQPDNHHSAKKLGIATVPHRLTGFG
jgi:hypothetical protein